MFISPLNFHTVCQCKTLTFPFPHLFTQQQPYSTCTVKQSSWSPSMSCAQHIQPASRDDGWCWAAGSTVHLSGFPWDSGRNTLPVITAQLLSVGKGTPHPPSATQATSLLRGVAPCPDALKCALTVTCAEGVMAWEVAYGQVCSRRNIWASYPDISWFPF